MLSKDYYQISKPMKLRVSLDIPKITCEALEKVGISLTGVTHLLKSVTVKSPSGIIHGIGFYNKKGGVEFYSPFYKNKTMTLKKQGTVYIPYRIDKKSENCLVFFDFMDYLAYRTLVLQGLSNLPWKCDCLIISNVSVFTQTLLDCELYKKVYCLLPFSEIGDYMRLTLKQCLANMINLDYLYQSHGTVYNWLIDYHKNNKKLTCVYNGNYQMTSLASF